MNKCKQIEFLYLKRVLYITLLSFSLLSVNSHAEQNYQIELQGGYEKEDADTSTDKSTALSVEIYFSPVNTENKPLAEAAFLDKSSSVIIGYIKVNSDFKNSGLSTINASGPLFAINYVTETDAFILGAVYSMQDIDTDPDLATGDTNIIGFNIGKYLDDTSAIEVSYISTDTGIQSATLSQTSSIDIENYSLSFKTVRPLNDTSFYRFGTSFEYTKTDSTSVNDNDSQRLEVQGEYYFTRMTSLGAMASFNSSDDITPEGKTLAIGGTHFFIPQIALTISWSKFFALNSQDEDTDSISVDAIARF
jgi:hypothetical protein